MSRNLDPTLAAALSNGVISPAVLAALTFKDGVNYVWSGVGDLVYNGNTFKGVGQLGKISPISEGSDVKADGLQLVLNGIGSIPVGGSSGPPSGITNPVTPPAGQSVLWATPRSVSSSAHGGSSATATTDNAVLTFTGSSPLDFNAECWAQWSDFDIPVLPDDAVVAAVYPVMVVNLGTGVGGGAVAQYRIGPSLDMSNGFSPPGSSFTGPNGQITSTPTVAAAMALQQLSALQVGASLWNTLSQSGVFQQLEISYIGLAIYYTSESNNISPITSAINTFQAGAPAKVWFGLMNSGALLGAPYLIFSGVMDQLGVDINPETSTITVSLENRLTNLMRPSGRRYTSADQHLFFPDDTGFNWVEILNDIALRWGS